ncbi:MAG: hypothetical protein BGO49_17525 [Planctomycetales bacterium 71-10]|nr:MAG: hypothetical protein BGO49_17525 [Planctomycetales bacterium 71-10]
MSYFPDVSQNLAYMGGLAATTTALIAESVSSEPAVGAGSFLLGGAGLIAAVSAFTKDFWQDRQKQREHELAALRIRSRADRAEAVVAALLGWIKAARAADPALPPAPEIGPFRDQPHDE